MSNVTAADNLDELLGSTSSIEATTPVADPVATTEVGAPAVGGSNKNVILSQGQAIYRTLSNEQKQGLSRNSGKIHFISVLGTHSIKMPRTESAGNSTTNTIDCYCVVGAKFKTDIDIQVPVINFVKPPHDVKTAPAISGYRDIKAGETFVLSRIEVMYMFADPKIGLNGYCEAKGSDRGVTLIAKVSKNYDASGIPTPALRYTDNAAGSIKTTMEFVDTEAKTLLPEYAEKFADLYVVRQGGRTSDGMPVSKAASGNITALALANILKLNG